MYSGLAFEGKLRFELVHACEMEVSSNSGIHWSHVLRGTACSSWQGEGSEQAIGYCTSLILDMTLREKTTGTKAEWVNDGSAPNLHRLGS